MPSLRPVSIGPGITFPIDLHRSEASPMGYDLTSPQSARDSNVSLKSELSDLDSPEKAKHTKEAAVTSDKEQLTDSIDVTEKATGTSEYNAHQNRINLCLRPYDCVCQTYGLCILILKIGGWFQHLTFSASTCWNSFPYLTCHQQTIKSFFLKKKMCACKTC